MLQRIADVLAELSVQSEAKAAPGFDRPQIAQVKSAGGAPRGERESTFDIYRDKLVEWLEEAERAAENKRPAKRFDGSHDAWVTHVLTYHEGSHYAEVARVECVSATHIRRLRERHGRDAREGLKRGETREAA